MDEDYELITTVDVEKSMIRKIGENQYLKIIPSERRVDITTITQNKITEPIKQEDEVIFNAYPKKIVLYRNSNKDNKYETEWETIDGEKLFIPATDIKNIYSLLSAKNLVLVDNMLNLSNILGMVIKQHTLEEKIESIKETM